MKNMRKILLALVLVLTMLVGMTAITASAADNGTTLYLTPNANWKVDNARFAAYFFGSGGNAWADMTANSEGVYEVTVPSGSWTHVIFCRMSPSAKENNWDNKWNQTDDLPIPTDGTNRFTVKEGTWDNGGGTWDIYGTTCRYSEEITLQPTCTEAGSKILTCTTCAETHTEVVEISANGHNFGEDGSAEQCSVCGADFYYIVAGVPELCTNSWKANDENNKMSDEDGDGVFEKVYTNVPAGTYEIKVVKNGSKWINDTTSTQKDQNHVFTVGELSDVTVKFDSATDSYSVVVTPVSGDNDDSGETPDNPGETPDNPGETPENPGETPENPGETPENPGETPVVGETVTVYFRNNWLWSEVSVYYWIVDGENEVNNEWPGTDMTLVSNDGTYDIYSASVPANAAGIIFNGVKDDGSGDRNQSPKIMEGIVEGAGWEMLWDGENLVIPYIYSGSGNSGEPVEITDYYLVGYLNNEDNYAESYKFVDGKLTTTFSFDSYVLVKDNAGNLYFAAAYCTDKTVDLAKGNDEKMLVSAGVEVTFTLVVNDDGTLTLSYAEAQSGNTDKPADTKPEDNKPADPTPEQPEEPSQPEEPVKLNFFQKIWRAIRNFFGNIGAWFKNLIPGKKK